MFRTIKLKPPFDSSLLETGRRVREACQLDQFMDYNAKDSGKTLIYVNPKYTSQKCSKCGFIDKNNRKGSAFHCKNSDFKLHADLNASRNIEVLGKSGYFRLLSTGQSLRFDESMPTGMGETSNKPPASAGGS